LFIGIKYAELLYSTNTDLRMIAPGRQQAPSSPWRTAPPAGYTTTTTAAAAAATTTTTTTTTTRYT